MQNINNQINFVEVKDEPNHKEVFDNKYVRIYIATIMPNKGTMFHRHVVDTIYVVISGGEVSTEDADKSTKYPINFPEPISIFKKIKMALDKIIKGAVYMEDGFLFFLTHKNNPTIHRAVASKSNPKDMIMMGIEIKENRYIVENFNSKSQQFDISRINLKFGQKKEIDIHNNPYLIVSFNKASIHKNKMNKNEVAEVISVDSGSFLWISENEKIVINNKSNKAYKGLIINLKKSQ